MPVSITHAHATKTTQPQRIYDVQTGLHLWVKTASRKYWIFRSSVGHKRIELSLGAFPAVGVAEARKKAQELREAFRNGQNVLLRDRPPKDDPCSPTSVVFADFAREYIGSQDASWRNRTHSKQWASTIKTYVNPVIGQKTLQEITTEDVLTILKPIWERKTETASRIRGRVERILGAATVRHLRTGLNPAQWRGHLEYLLPKPEKLKNVAHHPALPYPDIPEFFRALRQRTGPSALALEFCILTAARTGEVIGGLRSEIHDNVWIIPGNRMKAGKEHRVPLSDRALSLLTRATELDADSAYLFSSAGRPLSSMAMLQLLKRMGRADLTVHGFRSTFRDWVAEETNHSPEVVEMSLAHTIANRVESAYRRGNLLEKRRRLLCDWEDYCLNRSSSTQVLRLAI